MRLAVKLSFAAAAALLLASSGSARADTTYTITATPGGPGTISGYISGTGTTVTSFDITGSDLTPGGLEPFTFDSADDATGYLDGNDFTASGTLVSYFYFLGSGGNLIFNVTGDFTSGLVFLSPQNLYNSSGGSDGYNLGTVYLNGQTETIGSLSLTPDVAPTPEPSSWLLLATGLAGLGSLAVIRHSRPSLTRTRELPSPLSA